MSSIRIKIFGSSWFTEFVILTSELDIMITGTVKKKFLVLKINFRLFINHGIIKCTELIPELQSVANFLKKSPKEVVVLNFYRFPHPKYFSENKHLEILRIIRDIFGDLIYPYSRYMHRQGPKLSDFWQKQQRVVISYRQDNLVRRKLL